MHTNKYIYYSGWAKSTMDAIKNQAHFALKTNSEHFMKMALMKIQELVESVELYREFLEQLPDDKIDQQDELLDKFIEQKKPKQ